MLIANELALYNLGNFTIMSNIWLQLLKQHRAIAVIRCDDFALAYQMALAVAAGGINLIEITWNSDCPAQLVNKLRAKLPHCTIGVGTILNCQQLNTAVLAGAQFAFAPHFDPDLLHSCLVNYDIPLIPGAFSPTEIVNAWQNGATAIKVFPIKSLGGADYIKCLQAPLGQIPLIPTGGITVDNAKSMLDAGAIAVGISSNLFPKQAIANRDWSAITNRTIYLLQQINNQQLATND